jgi:hypothetical protein
LRELEARFDKTTLITNVTTSFHSISSIQHHIIITIIIITIYCSELAAAYDESRERDARFDETTLKTAAASSQVSEKQQQLALRYDELAVHAVR